jgi:hypothetical protein
MINVACEQVPEDIRERISFKNYDFFQVQVNIGAAPAAFLLRNILHN